MTRTPDSAGSQGDATASSRGQRFLQGIGDLVAGLWRLGPMYLLIAASLGLALWPLTDIDAIRYIVKNDLSVAQRYRVLIAVAISFVVTTVTYLGVWLRLRRRRPGLSLPESIAATNGWAFVALVLPMITALGVLRIETKHPVFTGFLTVMITALAMRFFYRLLGLPSLRPPEEPFQQARRPLIPRVVFGLAVATYASLISYYTVRDHHNMSTSIYDLGIYDNLVWQTAHGHFLDCSLIKGGNHASAHFDPILWLVAQIYRVYQRAETLLVFQTLWLASGAFAVYAIARRRLINEWFAALLGVMYLMHPALHGINMFDFHSLALIVPTSMWAVYLLDVGGFKRYWLVWALLVISREDISLLMCFVGAYAILTQRVRTGLATIALSLVYLTLVKRYAMPDSSLLMAADKAYSYIYYYEEMIPHAKEGTRGLVITLITNPLYALQVLFKEEKLLYFLHLLLPMLALPFAAGRKVVLTLYGMIFIGLASRKHVYSLHFQYSALLLPMLFAALPDGLARVTDSRCLKALGLERARLAWTLVLGMLTATVVTSVKYGVIFPNASFKAGWSRLVRIPTQEMTDRYAKLREFIAYIGPDAGISSTSDIGPHISNRRRAYHWPTVKDAEFLLLRVENFKKEDQRRLERVIKRNKFQLVDEGFGMKLYQRAPEEPAPEEASEPAPSPRDNVAAEERSGADEETGGTAGGTPDLQIAPIDDLPTAKRTPRAPAKSAKGKDAKNDKDDEDEDDEAPGGPNGP